MIVAKLPDPGSSSGLLILKLQLGYNQDVLIFWSAHATGQDAFASLALKLSTVEAETISSDSAFHSGIVQG